MANTLALADRIVHNLTLQLSSADLPAFRSIYVCGSFCRGDWLNCSSDLDLHMITDDSQAKYKDSNLEHIKTIVTNALDGESFFSHCPRGVEYGFSSLEHIPHTTEEACHPSPYAYLATLMFDLKEHHITVYGEEINDLLPEAPDPKTNALSWLLMLVKRIHSLKSDDFRIPFNVYKTILASQLHHGEASINKYRILELYQKHVPHFEMKWFGELVIRNYLGSFYPDRLPLKLAHQDYIAFIDELVAISNTLG